LEAGKRTLTNILNKNRVLEIPFFQRSYVWGDDNWDRFLDDMQIVSEQNKDYFLGSIILKQLETPSNSSIGDVRGVIDGQQRLTTLCIFFKCLCSFLNIDTYFDDIFRNRNKDIILRHNHYDHEAFDAVLNDKLTDEIRNRNLDSSIIKCFDYFSKQKKYFF